MQERRCPDRGNVADDSEVDVALAQVPHQVARQATTDLDANARLFQHEVLERLRERDEEVVVVRNAHHQRAGQEVGLEALLHLLD